MRLQALGADLLHHALHWRIDRSQPLVAGLEKRLQQVVAGTRHRRHHAVRADRHDAVGRAERNGLLTEGAARIGMHALHDVANEGPVLRTVRGEAGLLVAAPDDHVCCRLDLSNLVAVGHVLVAREIEHAVAGAPHGLTDREQHCIAEASAREHHGFAPGNLGRRAGGPHHHHRISGPEQHAQVRGAPHLEGDQRDQPARGVHPGARQRDALHQHARPVDLAREHLEVLQAIELAGPEAPRGGRRLDHDLDDQRRQTCHLLHRRPQILVHPPDELRVAQVRRRPDPREHTGDHRIALLGAAQRLDHVAEVRGMHVAEVA